MNRMRLADIAVIAVFFAGLLAPAAAFLAGMRARAFEERPLTAAPGLASKRLFDPSYYEAVTDYLTDRNPLREGAVIASARLAQWLTGDASTDSIIAGKDGWLFLRGAIAAPCIEPNVVAAQIENLAQLGRALDAAGKDYVISIAPDKNAIYPDMLTPPAQRLGACAASNRSVYRTLLTASGLKVIDAWTLLDAARKTTPVYLPEDTHWNEFGSAALVAAVAAKFDPQLLHGGADRTGEQVAPADLSRMAGLHRRVANPVVQFARAGSHNRSPQQIVHGGQGPPFVLNRSVSAAPLSTKRLLVIHDSYMYVAWDQLAQFYADAFYVHWNVLTPDLFGALAREADLILIETAEREFDERLAAFFVDDRMAASLRHDVDAGLQESVGDWWPRAALN